jgi:hypothetical protein
MPFSFPSSNFECRLNFPDTVCPLALRHKKDILLNAMDVFIKEPLLEWISRADSLSAGR